MQVQSIFLQQCIYNTLILVTIHVDVNKQCHVNQEKFDLDLKLLLGYNTVVWFILTLILLFTRTFILFLENDDDNDMEDEDTILDQPGVDENMDFENNDETKLSPQQLEHLTF